MKRLSIGIVLFVCGIFPACSLDFELQSLCKAFFDAGLLYIHENYVVNTGAGG